MKTLTKRAWLKDMLNKSYFIKLLRFEFNPSDFFCEVG